MVFEQPVAQVLLHMAGAVLITAYTARLLWAVRGPRTEATLEPAADAFATTR